MLDRKASDKTLALDTSKMEQCDVLEKMHDLQHHLVDALEYIDSLPQLPHPVEQLTKSFTEDPDYAHGWHCNIAKACYDSIARLDGENHDWAHDRSNEAATRFMKLCFNVETKA